MMSGIEVISYNDTQNTTIYYQPEQKSSGLNDLLT